MFLVIDEYSDYVTKKDYKELKELLVEEVLEEINNNYKDKEILDNCLNILKNLIIDADSVKIIKELEQYGWRINDFMQIHRDIYDLNTYLSIGNKSCKELLQIIEEELK